MYTILLVEDEIISLRGLQAGIDYGKAGFGQVLTADNIRQAKKLLEDTQVAVMLCDIEMPGGTGLELQQWLKEHSPLTVTVFLSCHADFVYAQQSVKLGAFDYILKPAPYELLTQVLKNALEKYCEQVRTMQLTEVIYPREDIKAGQEKGGRDRELTDRIKEYVGENLSKELGREQIGASFYLNPDYVARVFKKTTGVALSKYIFDKRIQVARMLLQDTEEPVMEICGRIGYQNQSHFTKIFKKETGMTPMEYRQRSKEKA